MEGWLENMFHCQGVNRIHSFHDPIICKDCDHEAIWRYLLDCTFVEKYDDVFRGKRITLYPGQIITTRRQIAEMLKINEYKVQRVLKAFEEDGKIKQITSNKSRLITIIER